MRTTASRNEHYTATEPGLCLACELREKSWKLGCTIGHGQKPRERTRAARDPKRLLEEVGQAKARCGLPETPPVVSCDEAGREGFWLPRFLQAQGITNPVVDSSSLAGNRRKRRATTEALDVRKLLPMLMRYAQGAPQVWPVVTVPSGEVEEQRHLHRDLATLTRERTRTSNRIKGLLSTQGGRLVRVNTLPEQLEALRLWEGAPVPPGLRAAGQKHRERLYKSPQVQIGGPASAHLRAQPGFPGLRERGRAVTADLLSE
jgi:transposase